MLKSSDNYLSPYQIAEFVHKIETEEPGLESGVQDQYAATFGGIDFMEIDYPTVKISSIKINEKKIFELESQMVLVYFGSRSSSYMHLQVIENYKEGKESTINAFEILKKSAYEMVRAIKSENIKEVGDFMNQNWDAQKVLHPMISPPIIQKAERISFEKGAIDFKCNGAGGGGSAIILAEQGYVYELKKSLIKENFTILPCKLNFNGLEIY